MVLKRMYKMTVILYSLFPLKLNIIIKKVEIDQLNIVTKVLM